MRLADPTHNEAKMKLAEIYEILNEPRKALELVYEGNFSDILPRVLSLSTFTVIDSRKKRNKDTNGNQPEDPFNPSTSLFAEERVSAKSKGGSTRPQNRLSHAQLKELEVQKEREVARGWARVNELWSLMLHEGAEGHEDAAREWLIEAEKLVETFRETRNLFLTSRVCD